MLQTHTYMLFANYTPSASATFTITKSFGLHHNGLLVNQQSMWPCVDVGE